MLRSKSHIVLGRGRQLAFLFAYIGGILSFVAAAPVAAQSTGYQEYYVLGYEEHIWRAFNAIQGGGVTGDICSTVSLVATADHQVVYYDHWEDGYEADLLNPTQGTTEVYGDGDLGNGGTGDDLLRAGGELTLTSDQGVGGPSVITASVPVSPTRDSAYLRYDGGDRVVTSGGPVDVTHAMWPLGSSWAGGAWEVYSRQAYAGTYFYRLPVGEDLYDFGGGDTGSYGDFRDVYLQLEAFENNTTVSIESGSDTVNLTLDQGQTYFSEGYIDSSEVPSITISAGTTIRSNKPVQVGLMTGADPTSGFQGRFLIVLPEREWGADYVVPVPSGGSGDEAEIYLSNPNDFPITVHAYDAYTEATFAISPTGQISATVPYSEKRGGLGYVPQDSAARFTSPDGVFGVVVSADTSDTTYDWGFSAVPARFLTRDYYVPWAPGNYHCPGADCTSYDNGSPVWVTPLTAGTVFYVDHSPLDGVVDETFTLDVLDQRRIFDPDNNNTGMHVWATGEFAAAWGEDPRTAGGSDPYLDLGVTMLPLLRRWLDPVLTLDKTADPTNLPLDGGVATYTLVARAHNAPVVDVDITDTLPISWSYVSDSTQVVYPDGTTGDPEPMINDSTLFWDLSTSVDLNQSLTLTFQAQITDTTGVSVSVNRGEAVGRHEYADALFNPTDEAPVYVSPFDLIKSVSSTEANIDDTLVYTLSYANTSDSITATNVVLRDAVPIQHVSFQSASNGGAYSGASGTITWSLGALEPGASGVVTFAAKVNAFVEDGTIIENRACVSSDQTGEIGSNEVGTTILAPEVAFQKSGPTVAARGEVITYVLSYENVGGAQATGVAIEDTLPLSTTYVTGSLAIDTGSGWIPLTDAADGDQGAYISPTLVITPGVVTAGEGGQIRFSAQFEGDLPPGSLVLNAATLDRDRDIPRESNLVVTQISDLLIHKAAEQAIVAPGGVISYVLTYENDSETVTQTNVCVREPVPAYTHLVSGTASGGDQIEYSWDNGTTWFTTLPITPVTHIRWWDAELSPGMQETVSFAAQVNAALPEGTTIQNMARISSTQTAAYVRQRIPSNQVDVETVDLWAEKQVSQPSARAGDLVSYTIAYGNHGTADVTGVQILDTIPSGAVYETGSIWGTGADPAGAPDLLWDVVGTVDAGAGARHVGYAVALDSDLLSGTIITNTAVVSSAYGLKASAPVSLTVTTEADLAVTKRGDPGAVNPGEVLTYTLVYTNEGPSDAGKVTITDTLPLSVTFGGTVDSALAAPVESGRRLVWYTPTLAAGTSGTIAFTVTVDADASGVITNDVVIAGSVFDPTSTDNGDGEATVVSSALVVEKVALDLNEAPVYPGDEIDYRVVVTNPGPCSQDGVVLGDPVPANTTLVSSSVACTAGATCGVAGGEGPAANNALRPADFGGMAVALIDGLDPGGVLTLTFRVTVNDGVDSVGENVAVAESDSQGAGESSPVYPPGGGVVEDGLAITKVATDVNGVPLYAGEVVEYRIAVTNTNAVHTQHNVIIDDPLPADMLLMMDSVECSLGAACGGGAGAVTANVGTLGPGGVLTLTFQVTVSTPSSVVANVATVRSDNQNEQESPPVTLLGDGYGSVYLPLVMRGGGTKARRRAYSSMRTWHH